MANVSIDAARKIKARARALAEEVCEVTGVGITKVGQDYAVKVNVEKKSARVERLPKEIDGVEVVYEATGTIKPR